MYAALFAAIVLVCVQVVSAINIDASDFKFNALRSNLTGTNSYGEAIAYGQANPTRDGGSWAGW